MLADLNPQQREAVTAPPGPVLVLAGPGSGKTRVLTYRLAHLVRELGVPAHQIVALTFTNRAAREMEGRALEIIGSDHAARPRLGTFHSFFAGVLRREADHLPVSRDYVIFDETDQQSVVKQAMKELNLDPQRVHPTRLLAGISRAKNELLAPDEFEADSYLAEITLRVYERYERLLRRSNALDFDDLLLWPVRVFRAEPSVLAAYRRHYPHLLVDEFQDTNTAQYALLHLLAGDEPDLYVVGDPDQSIYRWRGADPRNLRRLHADYPGLATYLLEQNYRSTQNILDVGMAVIDREPDRTVKALFTERGAGDLVHVREAYDPDEEAQFVVDTIALLTATGEADPGDCAVMYRANAQSRALEEAFFRAGLPYRLVGAQRFYGRREIKDVIAYLRLIHNPADEVSLQRVINTPSRGIGQVTLDALFAAATASGRAPAEVLLALAQEETSPEISARAARPLAEFGRLLDGWLPLRESATVDELMDRVLADVDYQAFVEGDPAEDRWANVLELRGVALDFSETGLSEFLQQVALVSDQDTLTDQQNAPTLLTLHAAKGLEFPVVFIVGLDEGELPHFRSMDDPEALAEERRLFYVGITRAKDRVFLTRAFRRRQRGYFTVVDPSRFLEDLPSDRLEGDLVGMRSSEEASYARQTRWEDHTYTLAEPRYSVGMRVSHPRFGEGVVLETQVDHDDEEVTVNFEDAGVKRLAASLAGLEIQS